MRDIDERFGSDEGQESDGMFCILCVNEWDRAVERHRRVVFVFKDVDVP